MPNNRRLIATNFSRTRFTKKLKGDIYMSWNLAVFFCGKNCVYIIGK